MQSIDIFPWNENFNIGFSEVDKQHRKLVEILNNLAMRIADNASEEDLSSIFDELTQYTLYHFQTEEKIWNKHLPDNSVSKEHLEGHQMFIDSINKLKSEQYSKPVLELGEETIVFLVKWIAKHILEDDRYISYVVFALQDGQTLEEAKSIAKNNMTGIPRILTDIIISAYSTLSSNTLSLMRELNTHIILDKKTKFENEYRQLVLNLSTSFINLPLDEIDSAIQSSLESMARFVGADRAYIFEYNTSEQTTSNTYEWCSVGTSSQIDSLQNLPIDISPEWQEIHFNGNSILVENVSDLPEGKARDMKLSKGTRSLATSPLMKDSTCIGFVGFEAVKKEYLFSKKDIELLDLFSKLLVNVEDRKGVESELSLEKSFLKALVQTIPDLVWFKNQQGSYLACNTRFEKLFNKKESEIVGKNDYNFVDKEQADSFRKNDKKAIDSGKQHINEEELTFASDGHKEVVQTTKVPMYSDTGKLMGVLGMARDITERKEHQNHLEYIAHYDALTGLPNRVLLSDRLHQALAQTRRYKTSLAVVYLDLDGFKQINDVHGHENGDKLLAKLATRMRCTLREGDTISRLGGDEFVVVLLDLNTHEDCIPMLKRLLKASSQKLIIDNVEMQVTSSLGVTFFDAGDEIDADQLLRQADQAMYQAKLSGKNRYYTFDVQKDEKIRTHHESLDEIEKALINNEFELYYQPKVNMRTGKTIGCEALIRWNHPTRGFLAPGFFLPVIQGHLLSVELGNWVLNSAMKQIQVLKAKNINIPISVNIDAIHLQQKDFVEQLVYILEKHPTVQPEDIILEVLETSALEDIVHVSNVMKECKDIGISFSLDDFGTGYSSLTYLKRIPAKEIKIDKSFVCNILEDPDDLAIIDGVLGLAFAFRREVIAEGVESIEHGAILLKLGCETAQGYAIARPMPADKIVKWIQTYQAEEKWKNIFAMSREDLPLLYAFAEHKAWLKSILLYLQNKHQSSEKLNSDECRFGIYLYKNSPKHRKASVEFNEIEKIHRELHTMVKIIVAQHEQNNLVNLEESMNEIKMYSRELTNALIRFETQNKGII
ncbi:MAG: diguanylate cyclase (GGDEF)-like protein/hemerythrin-like metal-binding protein [Sulfurimonas sp.]|jgi:diguanylate cyclase (GGDEF)-like protein/hemerythrin-like metal-binding protein/PAS domain S-box-containing protein